MSGTMLDCRGLACPEPVLRVKDALEQGAAMLAVVVDNDVLGARRRGLLRPAAVQIQTTQIGRASCRERV